MTASKFSIILIDCEGRVANAIRTGVNVLDFRHVAHHSLSTIRLESNIFTAKKLERMALIQVEVKINATQDRVWEIISDLDNEPKFWKGTKMVKNISKTEEVIKREITIAFRDQKCLQEVRVFPKSRIEAKFTEGVLNGSKIISIENSKNEVILKTEWDIKLGGMMNMFTNLIKNHIKSGTEQAMNAIKEEIEGVKS